MPGSRDPIGRSGSNITASGKRGAVHWNWCDRDPRHWGAFKRERAFWQDLQEPASTTPERGALLVPTAHLWRQVLLESICGFAASAALIASRLTAWWQADYSTDTAHHAEITLPDGSIANLNTDSAIAVTFSPAVEPASRANFDRLLHR